MPRGDVTGGKRIMKRDAWAFAPTFITLVYGPPGGGKSTYVDQHARPGDFIVDYDRIAVDLGSPDSHDHPAHVAKAATAQRDEMLGMLQQGRCSSARAWIVSSRPNAPTMFPHHRAVLVDPGPDETHRRASMAGRPERWHALIDDYYA